MKLRLTVLLLGIMTAQSAFASRATEVVMGTGESGVFLNGGSLSHDDGYNIFYNPAYINEFKNWAILEKDTSGRAMGGAFASLGRFNLGAYFNRVASTTNPTFTAIQVYPGNVGGGPIGYTTTPIRPIDLFFGMDMGSMKLGAGLTYAGQMTSGGVSSTDVTLNVGLLIGKIEPFASFKVIGTEGNGNSQSYIRAGARYKMGDLTPYVGFATSGSTPNLGQTTRELLFGGGLGGHKRLGEGARMIYSASVWVPSDSPPAPANGTTRIMLPLELSIEGDATSWLTVRGGIHYNLIDRIMPVNGTQFTAPDTAGVTTSASTLARFGATFHWKPIDFDWAVGGGGGSIDSANFDFANGLFTLASLSYRW